MFVASLIIYMKYYFSDFFCFWLRFSLGDKYLSDKTLSFCSDVGPVELHFAGDSVLGRYRIAVVKDPFDGIIKVL